MAPQPALPEQFMIFNHLLTHHIAFEDAHPVNVMDVASQRKRDNFTPSQLVLSQHQALFAPFIVRSTEAQF